MAGLGFGAAYGAGAVADELQRMIAERLAAQRLASDQEMQRREQDRLDREARQRELEHQDLLKQQGVQNARQQAQDALELQGKILDRLQGKPGSQLSDANQPFQFGTGFKSALEGAPQPFAFKPKPVTGPMGPMLPESQEDLQLADFNKIREVPQHGALVRGGKVLYQNVPPPEPLTMDSRTISVNGKNVEALQDKYGNYYTADAPHTLIATGIGPKVESDAQQAQRWQSVFQYGLNKMDTMVTNSQAQYARIEEARTLLNKGDMASDAMVAPKMLSAVIGGFGTGFRLTNAEIQNAAKGQTLWEEWLTKAQRWRPTSDPGTDGFAIPPAMRASYNQLLDSLREVIGAKIDGINNSRLDLLNAEKVDDLNSILVDAEINFSGRENPKPRKKKDEPPPPVTPDYFRPIGSTGREAPRPGAAPPPGASAGRSSAPPAGTPPPPSSALGRSSGRSTVTPPAAAPPPGSIRSGTGRIRLPGR